MADIFVNTMHNEFNPDEEASLPLNTVDLYRSSFGFRNNGNRRSFHSSNLNFDDEKESFAHKQLFSPNITKRFESIQSDLDEIGEIDENRPHGLFDSSKLIQIKRNREHLLTEAIAEEDEDLLRLIKRKSSPKRLKNIIKYSELKFTHKSIDSAEIHNENIQYANLLDQIDSKENKCRNLKLHLSSVLEEDESDEEEIVKYKLKIMGEPNDLSKLKSKCKVIDLNTLDADFTRMSPDSIGEFVSNKINSLEEGDYLILPDLHFIVNYLNIKQSCTLVGKQLTTMSVLGGILIGDFDDNFIGDSKQPNLSDQVKVSFSEIYFKFNPIRRTSSQQFSRKSTMNAWDDESPNACYYLFDNSVATDFRKDENFMSLMMLSNEGIRVEMRDCTVENTLPFGYTSSSILTELKTCVFCTIQRNVEVKTNLKSEEKITKINKIDDKDKIKDDLSLEISDDGSRYVTKYDIKIKSPSLLLYSSIFTGFNTMFKLYDHSKISIEGCFIENFKDNAIELYNPKFAKLENCQIKDNERSGVTIEWDDHLEETHKCKVVEIDNCEINNNGMNGIEIYCSKFAAQNLFIQLNNLKLSNNKENGVFLARMAITHLTINECKMTNNGAKGLIIRSVHSRTNKPKFIVQKSKFNKNRDNGIIIEDSGVQLNEVECTNNFRSGISIFGTEKPSKLPSNAIDFLINKPMNISIHNSTINENKYCGITATNHWKGRISISKSNMSMNSLDGVQLLNTFTEVGWKSQSITSSGKNSSYQGSKTDLSQKSPSSSKAIQFERCVIEDSIISSNKKAGINMKNVTLELSKVTMLDNKAHAIFIESIKDKYRLIFPEYEQKMSNVKGKIGGDWGLVNKTKATTGDSDEDYNVGTELEPEITNIPNPTIERQESNSTNQGDYEIIGDNQCRDTVPLKAKFSEENKEEGRSMSLSCKYSCNIPLIAKTDKGFSEISQQKKKCLGALVHKSAIQKDGFFSFSYPSYEVCLNPVGWKVKRKEADFVFLRQYLRTKYPQHFVPPLVLTYNKFKESSLKK